LTILQFIANLHSHHKNVVGKTRKALSPEEAVTRQWHRRHGRSGESPSKGSKGFAGI